MKKVYLLASAAIVAGLGWSVPSQAAPIIKAIDQPSDTTGNGTVSGVTIGAGGDTISLSKSFTAIGNVDLIYLVNHTQGGGSKGVQTETITNNTGIAWTDFHFKIDEPNQGNGVVFTSFMQSTLTGFTLDGGSGPRELDFLGSLASGASATASFTISPFDPGNGQSYTFRLEEVPTTGGRSIPEPATIAVLGASLIGLAAIRRRRATGNRV